MQQIFAVQRFTHHNSHTLIHTFPRIYCCASIRIFIEKETQYKQSAIGHSKMPSKITSPPSPLYPHTFTTFTPMSCVSTCPACNLKKLLFLHFSTCSSYSCFRRSARFTRHVCGLFIHSFGCTFMDVYVCVWCCCPKLFVI